MLPQGRIDTPGALQYLIVRGIERKRMFEDDRERGDFLNRLGDIFRFGLTQAAVNISVKRGEKIAREKGLNPLLP